MLSRVAFDVVGTDDQVHVRMGLVGVQHHRVAVLERELLPREVAARRQQPFRRRPGGHRQDDVVHELGLPATAPLHRPPAVEPGIDLEIPVLDQLCRDILALKSLAIVRFDFELALSADVLKMGFGAPRRLGAA